MDNNRFNELYQDFANKLQAGYFILELDQKGSHKLSLDAKASSILGVDRNLSDNECFTFVAKHVEDSERKLVYNSIETILMQENAEFSCLYNLNSNKINIRVSGSRLKDKGHVLIHGYIQDITNTIVMGKVNTKYQDELYNKIYFLPFVCYLKQVNGGKYIAASKKYLDFIGVESKDEVIGKTDYDLFPEEKAKKNVQEDRYALCIDRPLCLNVTDTDAEGNVHHFQTFRTKYIDSTGKDVLFVMSIDVTENYILAEERQKLLVRNKEKAEEANRAKTRFLYNISQEVRLPINSIISATDAALRHGDDKVAMEESLNAIKSSSVDLLDLATDIADIVSCKYGKVAFEDTPNSLSDFIKEIVDEYSDTIKDKKLTIKYDYNGFRNKYCYFDKSRVGKIFRNLISNSIKYTPKCGTITFSGKQFAAEKSGYSKFILTFADNGIGMSSEFLSNIFGLFERERSMFENGVHGSGLGMAVVKSLLDTMKGDIKIKSRVGEGTSVEITIVLKNSNKADAEKAADTVENLKTAKELAKGKLVLLVDDNETALEMSKDLLEAFGFEVETATNGALATNVVTRKGMDKYAIIFMSGNMRVMDGFEASSELKDIFPDSKTPIVCMASNDMYGFHDPNEKNVDDFISKPIDEDKVQRIVNKYLKK